MISLITVFGQEPKETFGGDIGWKPKATVPPYVGENVDVIIDELVKNINFKKYVKSIKENIQIHPEKYPDISKKYIK